MTEKAGTCPPIRFPFAGKRRIENLPPYTVLKRAGANSALPIRFL